MAIVRRSRGSRPLERTNVKLFQGDKDELASYYPSLGYSRVIRQLVDKHLRKLRENVNAHVGEIQIPEGDLLDD